MDNSWLAYFMESMYVTDDDTTITGIDFPNLGSIFSEKSQILKHSLVLENCNMPCLEECILEFKKGTNGCIDLRKCRKIKALSVNGIEVRQT